MILVDLPFTHEIKKNNYPYLQKKIQIIRLTIIYLLIIHKIKF